MKNSTVKLSEPKNLKAFNTRWTRAAIFIIALFLPAGAAAQSIPNYDQATHQQEAEIKGYEDSNQQESAPQDFSNPYQQDVISQYEQELLNQAVWALGPPDSRRPEFNNFFEARQQARQSILDKQQDEETELRIKQAEIDLQQAKQDLINSQ